MFVTFLRLYIDPDGELIYNGVPTTSPGLKLKAVLFMAIIPVMGGVLAFLPDRAFRRLFRFQLRSFPFLAGWGVREP